ncbi:MAG: FAD-binding protein [Clostridia bacterium]
MKKIIIIGSGLAGMSAAVTAVENGAKVILVSPFQSERSQSIMAAGGMNASLDTAENGDSPEAHAADTIRAGMNLANIDVVTGLCRAASGITRQLEKLGVVFTRTADGELAQRELAGQSSPRTVFAGACTGKQFLTALTRHCRILESLGNIERRIGTYFVKLLKCEDKCAGAILFNEVMQKIYYETADAVILATGGQNMLFGKTTGSELCDGCAAAAVFMQGVRLKNLEMIQFHPTTISTPQKHMLITEASRGEGGRLFYIGDDGKRVYFMEDKFGEKGNLKPRDVVSREIFKTGRQVYLDITFLGKERILSRLREVYDVCADYIGLDVTKEPIPVTPCVHYFMGGISVSEHHETSVKNLFAAGECAAIYHGANRLGGNSLLSTIYGGKIAAQYAVSCNMPDVTDAQKQVEDCEKDFFIKSSKRSRFPCIYILNSVAETMNEGMQIIRSADKLKEAIVDMEFYSDKETYMIFDKSVDIYHAYALKNVIIMARAILKSALERKESRGAHTRADYPMTDSEAKASYATYDENKITITFEKDRGQA